MIIKTIITFIILFSFDNLIGIFMPRTVWGLYVIVPYTLFIAICLDTFHDENNHLPILALIFGFIVDIYNANLIGLYAALFPIFTIIIKKFIIPITPRNFFSIASISIVAIMIMEITAFILVSFVTTRTMTIFNFIQHRLIITLLFNMMLLAIMYWPLTKLFQSKDHKKRKSKLS